MTKEDAIKILKCAMPYSNMGCGASDDEIEEAMTLAIQALEQQTCNDVANKQTVIDMIKDVHAVLEKYLDLLNKDERSK